MVTQRENIYDTWINLNLMVVSRLSAVNAFGGIKFGTTC